MDFHLSCASLSLRGLADVIESIPESFSGWQIVAEGRHNLRSVSAEFRDIAGSYSFDFTVHAPFSDINIASLNKAIRLSSVTEIADCIRAGADLGLQKFVIHPGMHSVLSSADRERAFLLSRESIKALSSLAESTGVELFVENMAGKDAIGTTPRELRLLLSGTKTGICLDISHAALEGQLVAFSAEERVVGMVHISDNDGSRDTHARIGSGKLELGGAVQLLKKLGLPAVIEAGSVEDAIHGMNAVSSML